MGSEDDESFQIEEGLLEEIPAENAELLFEESNKMLDSLREDRRMIQTKAQFMLVVIGASILFGFGALKDIENLPWQVITFLIIEIVFLGSIGALMIQHCLMPKKWMSEGALPKMWLTKNRATVEPKSLHTMMTANNHYRIDFNSAANAEMSKSLRILSIVSFLSPVSAIGVVGFLIYVL